MPVDADRPSLWNDLVEGQCKPPTLLLVTAMLAVALTGVVLVGGFLFSAMYGPSNVSGTRAYVYVRDETLGWLSVLASVFFVAGTAWIWTRGSRRHHRVYYGVAATLVVTIVTIVLAIAVEMNWGGDSEVAIFGIVCLGVAALMLVWLRVVRGYLQPRPWLGADGKLDLRCPRCGYRMIGLKEARCPECGTAYTVDELFTQQEFGLRAAPLPEEAEPAASNRAHPIS
jgi:hypothetical protein